MICCKKNEKNWFFPFFDQKLCSPVGFNNNFFATGEKKFQKWLFQDLLEGLKWKVTRYEHANFNELEMADNKWLGGHPIPPVYLGLILYVMFTNVSLWETLVIILAQYYIKIFWLWKCNSFAHNAGSLIISSHLLANLTISDGWLCPWQKIFAKDREFIANKGRSDYILSAVLHKLYHKKSILCS